MATVITRRSVIGHVRAFTRDDIPAVIRLYEKVYRAATVEPKSAFNAYWENVFLNNPLYDDRAPSLVYEDAEGHIIGFLGIMHRKCTFQQRSCDAAVPTNFMVDRGMASPTIALKLHRACYAGAQHLTITDGYTDSSALVAKMLGGKVVPFRNLIWVKPLLPITFRFFQAGLRGPARRTAMVMSTLFDRVLDVVKHQPNLPRQSDLEERQLIVEDLLKYSNWSFPRDLIRPQYDRKYAEWIFDLAEQRRRYGELQKRKVVDGKGRMLGWYVYYPNPGGIAFVLQLAAQQGTRRKVMEALFWSCYQAGSLAVSGQVQPRWLKAYGECRCYLEPGRYWTVCYSDDHALLTSILTGNSLLSWLDMEFPVRFNEFIQKQ